MDGGKGKGRRVKRKQVLGEDGWTVVSGTGSNASPEDSRARDARPTRIVDGLTVQKLASEFKHLEKRWQRTTCARTLENMLSLKDWKVEQAVCIGVGSFSVDWEHRWRSLWQLVLFVAVVKILQQHDPSIQLYVQEPAFSPLDIEFLGTLSMATPATRIETQITPTSFVFAPFVDWYILMPIFLKNKDPELYIGNDILKDYKIYANTEEKKSMLEESNGVGEKFVMGREKRRIPSFEEHRSALEGLMIYWKEDVGEDEE
ncbi:hypothetical protein K458DRAFT_308721 [Lentithecium fluviatile CBS 122367]|uniref:SRR1-like domain-containing protein n=1 Tax=Lentithecium fluviatile CBS 122367 TaxID=1168545 RepID=A0A6G1IU50_9PLEO|nr:hypothetical protein K458DRAFT_308721 [Lentithecium fluviatile CBS 122367]